MTGVVPGGWTSGDRGAASGVPSAGTAGRYRGCPGRGVLHGMEEPQAEKPTPRQWGNPLNPEGGSRGAEGAEVGPSQAHSLLRGTKIERGMVG